MNTALANRSQTPLVIEPTRIRATAARLTPRWDLDPSVTFLNHGSYGAVPRSVLEAQSTLRARMEREPVRFFKVDLENLMDDVRATLGAFVGCEASTLAPMMNATVAICTILHHVSASWQMGDEILITDHEYMSGVNELERLCAKTGAKIVRAKIPFPITSPEQVVDAVQAAMSSRTRLMIISHITSATSLIFPVEQIVPLAKAKGIDILLDGAHVPGQIPLNINALEGTYYVGSLHKWISAPKGTGFLQVPTSRQPGLRPVCLSSRAHRIRPERALYLRDFDYMGTDDYSGMLSVPAAIEAMGDLLPGGWPALYDYNHALALEGRRIVCEALGLEAPAPDSMIGSMATIILPDPPEHQLSRPTLYDDALQDALIHNHRVVVPIWRLACNNARVLRISAQVYNTLEHYHHLAHALKIELAREWQP